MMIRPLLAALLVLPLVAHAQDAPAPRPLAEATQHMKLPKGFQVSLFAGEPDVVQPIAMNFDERGRLWVCESLIYPKWITDGSEGNDRIIILEDTDHDGKFDKRKVFWDKGTNLSGMLPGFGGVWLCATPNFLFLPDANQDDVPDGPPQVLLDGWSLKAKHNVFNGLTWGPDGWLYGMNGITDTSHVGKPGTPPEQRVPMNCGVWRYHPTRHEFEIVCWGTTNPWGLDFNDYGQAFITNCVIHHLWHAVPGAHFQRMFGQDLNPFTYGLINSCADHIHWAGGKWTDSRGGKGEHSKAGGGHAHVGCMVYLGDNWPDEYRGRLYTCNLHGHRLNQDLLERAGSGYVAHHGQDFLMVDDTWFRGITVTYGPDGGVYVSDWSDDGECHDYDLARKDTGRIYKITHGKAKPVKVDVAALSDADLVQLQLHKNDWFVRQARRILQERAAAGKLSEATVGSLEQMLREHSDVTRRLRALWTLHSIGALKDDVRRELLNDGNEYMRAWAIQLELEDHEAPAGVLEQLAKMASSEKSPFVRLYLASGLQRLPNANRWAIAEGLASHAEDIDDQYLPLMIWYGIEPAVAEDKAHAVQLLAKTRIPLIREYIARRIAE